MLSGVYTLQPKNVVLESTSFEKTLTWADVDFTTALGASIVSGPFSLSLDIYVDNSAILVYFGGVYIGIRITTDTGRFNVSDRIHIAHVPYGDRILISPASVPQLANIEGNVTKIEVLLYGYHAVTVTVAPRLSEPKIITTAPARIGRDELADSSLYFITADGTDVVAPNVTKSLINTVPVGLVYKRKRIKFISIEVPPTPSYAGDIAVYGIISNQPYVNTLPAAFVVRSTIDSYVCYTFDNQYYLSQDTLLYLAASNINTTTAYTVYTSITSESTY